MKQPEVRKYLFDILQACDLLNQFAAGKTIDDYRNNPMLRSAIERQFEIVGEALNQAIKVDAQLTEQVSHASRIIAFRNRLIHGYASVADEVVWDILTSYLPCLHREVRHLLDSPPDPTP